MYEIYSVESRKGGVGKTTVALNLAKALVKKKYDVLLIDCDITGTPISKAATNSSFWKDDVVVAKKDGVPYNLIDFFNGVFLRGEDREQEIINGFDLNPKKVHLIGSEIYDENSNLIIDPRDLMDDLHSYWFLDFIESIADSFCKSTKQEKKAIVLDNSPGYVGIGRSVREWLTKEGPDKVTFVLVSSLDEQDIESTINSADEIRRMMHSDKSLSSYVKVIINRVPEGLLSESGGYDFKVNEGAEREIMVSELFPLDRNGFPKNIIKYDSTVSGQFIEASLIPKSSLVGVDSDLKGIILKLDNKAASFEQKTDQYADIASMDATYRKMLKSLSDYGYVRMSKILGGDLMPSYMLKNLRGIVGKLGSMVYPVDLILDSPIDRMKREIWEIVLRFTKRKQLARYSSFFLSLCNGLYKDAGSDRKDANISKLVNLHILLWVFFSYQEEYYHSESDYRAFLKSEMGKKSIRRYDNHIHRYLMTKIGIVSNDVSIYTDNLLDAFFPKFFHAMCYSLLRMIDCARDYDFLVDACISTIQKGVKTLSEDLKEYLKAVISKKTEEPDGTKFRQLIEEPYEMKTIQALMKSYVLVK